MREAGGVRDHRRLDEARGDSIDADPRRSELEGRGPAEVRERRLRCVVGRVRGSTPPQRGDGGDVHDCSRPLPDHVRNDMLHRVDSGSEVHREHAIPVLGGGLCDPAEQADPDVVIEHVDAPVRANQRVREARDGRLVGRVDPEALRSPALGADHLRGAARGALVAVDTHDVRAVPRHEERGRPPVSDLVAHGSGADDERDLPVKVSHVRLRPAARCGPQRLRPRSARPCLRSIRPCCGAPSSALCRSRSAAAR